MTELLVGHYRLESQIGAGSMGAVYRAVDTKLNRAVAIKLWRNGDGPAASSSRRMLKEARAASALNHPNIVIVHDFGETQDGDAFIVQELIDGRTLRDLLADGVPLTSALDIGVQVARALAAAHTAGVVHRDIKPENVMVRADGYAKVLDFGIAHLPELTAGSTVETMANDLIGTPAYMAPEIMLGGTIGPPADVFALGVMLYELVTGQQPFAAATAMGVMARIATEPALPMTSVDPTVPPGLDALVQSMLDKRPERRPTPREVELALPAFAFPVDPDLAVRSDVRTYTVGREPQLAQLHDLFARVTAGRSQIVGVSGEAGIGKSTLLEAFIETLQHRSTGAEPPTIVRVRCSENLGGTEAYLPVLEALDSLRTRERSSLDTLMRKVAPSWYAQLGALPASDGAGSQERLKRELRAFLHDASLRSPLVWLIEDLHWADVSTIDMLNYLAARFDEMRLLIVAAFRQSDMTLARHPFLAVRTDLLSKGLYVELPLQFLTRDDLTQYLELRFHGNHFPPSFVEAIHARTEGSPLFMTDLVRYLRDTGGVVETERGWEVARSLPGTTRELPESVRGMIARKIEQTSDADRKLLLAASVQGQEFDAAPLGEALGADAFDLEDQLETLEIVHGLVQRAGEHEYPDGALTVRYRFVHVLYQNVLYESLQPSRRADLCGRTGRALATHYRADAAAAAGRLAVLFEAARDFAEAGHYYYLASQRALSLFGFREALTLAERGLADVGRLPVDERRRRLELGLHMSLVLALRLVRGWVDPELEPTLARGLQLCDELGDPPERLAMLWNHALYYMIRGNLTVARTHLDALTEKANSAGESAYVMAACHLAGVTLEFTGDVRASSEKLELGTALHDLARQGEYRALFGTDPGMQARAMSSRPLWALGHPDRALARSLETVALSESQLQPETLAFSMIVLQGIHLYRGEGAEAIALGDRVIAMSEEYEFPQERAWGIGFQGAAFGLAGDLDRGIRQLAGCLDGLAALRSGFVRTMFLSLFAEALWRANRLDEGHAVVNEGFAYAETAGERGFLHELYRVRGALLEREGRLDAAEQSLREAVQIANRFGARSFELRAATDLARLLAATGRAAEGREMLAPLYAWFTEGLGTADLTAARTLLTELQRDS